MTTREPARPVTGYAVLGLLSLRPWTTYELAQQVRRSLHWFWTRAERRIYEEPKRLVDHGWVEAVEGWTGRRRHTTYAITEAGREALAAWLGTPAQVRTVEDEAMLRVFFADGGTLDQLRARLDELAEVTRERLEELATMTEQLLVDGGAFPDRLHLQALALRRHVDQEVDTLAWATWARRQTERWSSTTDPVGWDARRVLREVLTDARG
ncbi:PadR family transcriptional regulator [Nocardioides marinus]|uniref:DNA-binding PadR family transcriptional regulator n=1 Tax=Nocardioides marinus TaxID=374514 RepID=A0A7Y9YIE1_9ACTN|nr:PadR family transcriptional regulator [Nocardioides marinus]NYI11832.1 DNA-binding PadR family transcriptional regulator [Nocardioides marinus]